MIFTVLRIHVLVFSLHDIWLDLLFVLQSPFIGAEEGTFLTFLELQDRRKSLFSVYKKAKDDQSCPCEG